MAAHLGHQSIQAMRGLKALRGLQGLRGLHARELATVPKLRRDHASATSVRSSSATLTAAPSMTASTSMEAPTVVEKTVACSDGMARWPGLTSTGGLLRTLDWVGTVSFAHSGAVLAAASGMDLLGTAAVGTITAVGGGTIRDAVFLSRSPFWTSETEYLALCAAAALATFALWPVVSERVPDADDHPALFVGDTLGVAAFATIGVQNGVRLRCAPAVSILCGMATATFGGAVRDILVKRDVRIFHSHAEIYATTAAAGSTAYLLARAMGASYTGRVVAGLATAAAMRCAARSAGIRLPTWTQPKYPEQVEC